MNVTIKEITEAVGGRLLCGDEKLVIRHIAIDSRSSEGDDIFVPIIGAKVDAHRFIEGAFSVGCRAVLTSEHKEMSDPDHAWIAVDDTVEALHALGRLCRSRVRVPAVGVTGSVGKTTTREMIAYALSAGKKVYKTQKNYNSSVGLPITMSLMDESADIAVLELGMNVPGELGTISEIAELKMAVLTNVGAAHIEFYGSREAICREKYTITNGFKNGEGLLVINGDDPLLYEYRDLTGYPYVLYGTAEYCDYRAENIRMEKGSYCFDFVHQDRKLPVSLSVLGRHNVLNACAALAAADQAGVPLESAAASLSKFTGFQNRLQLIPYGTNTIIDDTYNASPDSMIAGVKVLSGFDSKGRKIAVLGDMKELGPKSPDFHREVGEAIAAEAIDELLLIGEMSSFIKQGAKEKGADYPIHSMESNEAAARYLKEWIRGEDTIYLKASNSMHLKEITAWLKEHE